MDVQGSSGYTALMAASEGGYADIVDVLLDAGEQIKEGIPEKNNGPAGIAPNTFLPVFFCCLVKIIIIVPFIFILYNSASLHTIYL